MQSYFKISSRLTKVLTRNNHHFYENSLDVYWDIGLWATDLGLARQHWLNVKYMYIYPKQYINIPINDKIYEHKWTYKILFEIYVWSLPLKLQTWVFDVTRKCNVIQTYSNLFQNPSKNGKVIDQKQSSMLIEKKFFEVYAWHLGLEHDT